MDAHQFKYDIFKRMWPEINSLINKTQLDLYHKQFLPIINRFIEDEKLDGSFIESFTGVFLPLAAWMVNKQQSVPLVFGVNGAQGSGKSTLCKLLKLILETLYQKKVCLLSIDDLYLSKDERLTLAEMVHPLLKTRGVPGTHNASLGIDLIQQLTETSGKCYQLPVFEKSIDDLLPQSQWQTITSPVDIILFEGWCVGAKPQNENELIIPLNELEKNKDSDVVWRQYINNQLSGIYNKLFSRIDYLIMLKTPDFNSVYEWRGLQEKKLASMSTGKQIMSEAEVKKFIMHFERITRACLKEMPGRADVLLNVNKNHQIDKVEVRC